MPGKKTVNVKKFLTDFREGASDADLMTRHGLDKRGLQKMLAILEERQLVPTEDLKRFRYASPATPEQGDPVAGGEPDADPNSRCSQCGAHVTEEMLTCPECGHVLPGETRWSRVQPERSARFRIPPWIIGCIIACPMALGLYAVFKHVLIPMSAASIQKRTHHTGTPAHGAQHPAPGTGKAHSTVPPIQEKVQSLTADGILLKTSSDFTIFTVSDRWYKLSRDEKLSLVTLLASALEASGLGTSFEIRDDAGIVGARTNPQAVELLDRYGFSETTPRSSPADGKPQPDKNPVPAGTQEPGPQEKAPAAAADR